MEELYNKVKAMTKLQKKEFFSFVIASRLIEKTLKKGRGSLTRVWDNTFVKKCFTEGADNYCFRLLAYYKQLENMAGSQMGEMLLPVFKQFFDTVLADDDAGLYSLTFLNEENKGTFFDKNYLIYFIKEEGYHPLRVMAEMKMDSHRYYFDSVNGFTAERDEAQWNGITKAVAAIELTPKQV